MSTQLIFGDNQFFGINHMSEVKAKVQGERFRQTSEIISVIDVAYASGIHNFMFNTHDRVSEICDHFRTNRSRYAGLRLFPSMPYAHKYANAVADKGIAGALLDFVFAGRSAAGALKTIVTGGAGVLQRDLIQLMRMLVDAEMRMFRKLDVQLIFLQNIVTDLLLGLRAKDAFVEFSKHVQKTYGVEAAFNTMNLTALSSFLTEECGLTNPVVCSSINAAGYLMNPSKGAYESYLRRPAVRPFAMSILASGAVPPEEALSYIASFPSIEAVVFGASSRKNIEGMVALAAEKFN